MATCYMCSSLATSDEHIPPLCIFPQTKDLPSGVDFRKQLISVPSCPTHNLTKSADDEYLLYVITSNISTNRHARRQWSTKVRRSYKRRPSKLGMFGPVFGIRVGGVPTGIFFLDKPRFDAELDRIARGLHYHASRSVWEAPIEIVSPILIATSPPDAEAANIRVVRLTAITSRFLAAQEWQGSNPEIFRYQITREDEPLALAIRMLFYEKFEVIALSIPSINVTSGDA